MSELIWNLHLYWMKLFKEISFWSCSKENSSSEHANITLYNSHPNLSWCEANSLWKFGFCNIGHLGLSSTLNMFEHVWTCLNMFEQPWFCRILGNFELTVCIFMWQSLFQNFGTDCYFLVTLLIWFDFAQAGYVFRK